MRQMTVAAMAAIAVLAASAGLAGCASESSSSSCVQRVSLRLPEWGMRQGTARWSSGPRP